MPCEITRQTASTDLGEPTAHVHPDHHAGVFRAVCPGAGRTAGQTLLLFATLGFVALSLLLTVRTFAGSRERRLNPALRFEPPGPDPLVATWTLDETPAVVACLRCCSTCGAQRRRFPG